MHNNKDLPPGNEPGEYQKIFTQQPMQSPKYLQVQQMQNLQLSQLPQLELHNQSPQSYEQSQIGMHTQTHPLDISHSSSQMDTAELPQQNQQQLSCPANSARTVFYTQPTTKAPFSSEDGEGTESTENNWQVVRSTKRRKVTPTQVCPEIIPLHNKYKALEPTTKEVTAVEEPQPPRVPKPPPIFVYGVTNFPAMVHSFRNIAEDDQYTTKCMADNTVKINCTTPETYRSMIRHMRNTNIIHHTYQPKEERAYRIVLKHVHHSVNTNDIKTELEDKGHAVRNITNGRHWKTKEPINLFFIDLEPADNNTEVFKIQRLQNLAVIIEPPKRYKGIIQCTRCQQYGHSKAYCNKPFVCVKCGGNHNTAECRKPRDTPATCALCNGPHTANYKGCEFYHNLLRTRGNANNRLNIHTTTTRPTPPTSQPPLRQQRLTYADVTKGTHNTDKGENNIQSCTLSTFLAEFKAMFNQLLQQNSMVLNMLTMLLNNK